MAAIQQHGAPSRRSYGWIELWRRHRPARIGWRRNGWCRCGETLAGCPHRATA